MKSLKNLLEKYEYGIAWRREGDLEFRVVPHPSKEWYADPFVINYQGENYIFVEKMDFHYGYGEIAIAKVGEDSIGMFRTIIKEPFHLSFPNVFLYNNELYMIPETYQSNQLRLYKCSGSIWDWKLHKVLFEGYQLVDSIVYLNKNTGIVIAQDITRREEKRCRTFSIDLDSWNTHEIELSGNWIRERPGGNFFSYGGEMYRVVQDCRRCYGDYLHLLRIRSCSTSGLYEDEVSEIHYSDFSFDSQIQMDTLHTYNRNDEVEVVDFGFMSKSVHNIIKWLWKRFITKNKVI